MEDSFIVFIPIAFLVLFPLMWSGIVALIAEIGGWKRISRKYPELDIPMGELIDSYSMTTFGIGLFGNYRGSMNIKVYESGIHLVPMFFFRINHPPIFIPWEAMTGYHFGKFFFTSRLILRLENKELYFYRHAAKDIHSFLESMREKS